MPPAGQTRRLRGTAGEVQAPCDTQRWQQHQQQQAERPHLHHDVCAAAAAAAPFERQHATIC